MILTDEHFGPSIPRALQAPPVRRYGFSLPASHSPRLEGNAVHVWFGNLETMGGRSSELAGLLSDDELSRMQRFKFDPDRTAFACARGMMRTILGMYLEVAPRELRFAYSESGKPRLSGPLTHSPLQFNLSHTSGAVLMALCRGRQIGIDIERIREGVDVDDIAKRFFSSAEQAELRLFANAKSRTQAFFHCWTRKEALLKATAQGLTFPLSRFDVSVDPEKWQVDLITRPDANEADRWSIARVELPCEYAGAIAVENV